MWQPVPRPVVDSARADSDGFREGDAVVQDGGSYFRGNSLHGDTLPVLARINYERERLLLLRGYPFGTSASILAGDVGCFEYSLHASQPRDRKVQLWSFIIHSFADLRCGGTFRGDPFPVHEDPGERGLSFGVLAPVLTRHVLGNLLPEHWVFEVAHGKFRDGYSMRICRRRVVQFYGRNEHLDVATICVKSVLHLP